MIGIRLLSLSLSRGIQMILKMDRSDGVWEAGLGALAAKPPVGLGLEGGVGGI